MKTTLELRPVYHRLEDRIRAHVILCWLALLLVRIVETTTGDTWGRIREDLQELHVGTFEGPAGTFRQRTELTTVQRDILTQLGINAPKKIIELATRDVLTSTNLTAWTHACRAVSRVPAGHTPDSVSRTNLSCGTRYGGRRVARWPGPRAAQGRVANRPGGRRGRRSRAR
jgi:hypothetical protein